MRSTDRGRTWSQPAIAAELGSVGVNDPESGDPVASGTRLQPAVAVDPAEVRVFVAWQDARFSQGQADAIALSWSSDGARTWSAPVKANATPPRCQPQPGGILAVAGGGDRRDSGRRLLRLPPQRRGRRAADGSLAGALPPHSLATLCTAGRQGGTADQVVVRHAAGAPAHLRRATRLLPGRLHGADQHRPGLPGRIRPTPRQRPGKRVRRHAPIPAPTLNRSDL